MSEDPDNKMEPYNNTKRDGNEPPAQTAEPIKVRLNNPPRKSGNIWTSIAAVFAVSALGLGMYFAIVSGGADVTTRNEPRPEQDHAQSLPSDKVSVEPSAPATPPPSNPEEILAQKIMGDSLQAKYNAIYRDNPNSMYEAYIDRNGNEVSDRDDFAIHVELFQKGAVSVLIAEGAHAGTRIGFFPVLSGRESSRLSIEKVGKVVKGDDRKTPEFKLLSRGERREYNSSMSNPRVKSQNAVKPNSAEKFIKEGEENGVQTAAFTLIGTPEQDGVFSIVLFNDDVYSIDLNTGDFTIDSVFMTHPDWQERVANECDPNPDTPCNIIDRNKIPVVKGVIDHMPGITSKKSPAPTHAGHTAPKP